jgi:UrcA family protein
MASALALGSVSAAAAAEEIVVTRTPAPSATVSLAGLDLDSPRGVATGMARIEAAATGMCLTSAVEPVGMRLARAKCYRTAVLDGYRQLDRMTASERAVPINAATVILTTIGG